MRSMEKCVYELWVVVSSMLTWSKSTKISSFIILRLIKKEEIFYLLYSFYNQFFFKFFSQRPKQGNTLEFMPRRNKKFLNFRLGKFCDHGKPALRRNITSPLCPYHFFWCSASDTLAQCAKSTKGTSKIRFEKSYIGFETKDLVSQREKSLPSQLRLRDQFNL